MKKVVGFIIVVLLVAGGVVVLKKKKEELADLPAPAIKSVTVETATPEIRSVEEVRSFMGRYYSAEHPSIASRINGFVQKIYVKEGERVKKGDLLAQIDDRELKAAIEAQKASIKALESAIESLKFSLKALKSDLLQAKSTYERNLKLYEAGALAKEKLDLSKVAMELKESKYVTTQKSVEAKSEELRAQKAQLDSKVNQLRYASLKAPADATVGEIFLTILKLLGERKRVDFQFPAVPVTALLEKTGGNKEERYLFVKTGEGFTPKSVKVLADDGSYAVVDGKIDRPVAVGSNDKLSRLFVLKSVKAAENE